MLVHALISGSQKIDLLLPVDETNMRYLIDKIRGFIDHTRPHCVSPELFALLKFLKDLDCLVYFNLSILSPVRSVSDFTNSSMSGACIIPSVGTFLRQFLCHFIKFNAQTRIQLFKQGSEVGGHHPATNKDYIYFIHKKKLGLH